MKSENFLYRLGGHTAVGVQRADAGHRGECGVQRRAGLHPACFRAREREEVDRVHQFAKELGATIVHPRESGNRAPGCSSVFFDDPDGIRLELSFVPGKGLLAEKQG